MNGPLFQGPLCVALSAVDGGLDEGGGEPEVGRRGLPEGVHPEGPEVLLALDLSPADGDGGTVGRGQLAEHHVHPDVFQEGVEVGVGVDLPGVTKV